MISVKFIRKDKNSETTKMFTDCPQYQGLDIGNIIEVECENGELKDYVITDKGWQFSHFGDTILYKIEPKLHTA